MFPETLRALRKNSGLSQEQLAKELKLSQSTVAQWETGRRQPDLNALVCIARYFGVSTDRLLGCEKETPAKLTPAELNEIQKFLVDVIVDLSPEEASALFREMLRRGIPKKDEPAEPKR